MRISFIRHAEPYYPDDSLTPVGHRESQALADHLAGCGITGLYASPRGRARLTADYTARRLNLPVMIEPWANELDGLYSEEYRHAIWDIDGAVLRAPAVVDHLNGWQSVPPFDHPRLAGHLERIRAGSDDFLARQGYHFDGTVYRVAKASRAHIAFFAHLGFGLAWLSHLLAIPLPLMWAGFYMHPSSVTTILFDERQPGIALPRLLCLGDVSHLHKAGLTPSNAGLIANKE
jgi:probable phosphoglycerate mutase